MKTNNIKTNQIPSNLFSVGLLLIILLATSNIANAQLALAENANMFIYGTVITEDGNEYTGQIRWDDEEAYWFDMFNSSKEENPNLAYLSGDELDYLDEKDTKSWGGSNWGIHWGDEKHSHSFECQFGSIKKIKLKKPGSDELVLTYQNGATIELDDGSNDIGADVRVYTQDEGEIEIEWKRIAEVHFTDTPAGMESLIGPVIFGTVESEEGNFTGFIQWDGDERVGDDEIDGDTRDGDLSIRFSKITSIEKQKGGSEIVLKSGRTFFLDGSNDVDSGNRGITINLLTGGRVELEWEEFEKLTLTDVPASVDMSYAHFGEQKEITGTVQTKDGTTMNGRIIFDLDEEWDFEMLDGETDELEYTIPFMAVKQIVPNGKKSTKVELKDGTRLLLEDSVDVDFGNDGVLIFSGEGQKPSYVAWENVELIHID